MNKSASVSCSFRNNFDLELKSFVHKTLVTLYVCFLRAARKLVLFLWRERLGPYTSNSDFKLTTQLKYNLFCSTATECTGNTALIYGQMHPVTIDRITDFTTLESIKNTSAHCDHCFPCGWSPLFSKKQNYTIANTSPHIRCDFLILEKNKQIKLEQTAHNVIS